jgi:flagellar protein FlaG
MATDPITISGNRLSPAAQARAPTVKRVTQKGERAVNTGEKEDPSRLIEAVEGVQKNLNMITNVDLHFTVHEASGEIMVIVTEESTGEVIREIPPVEVLNLEAKLEAMIGLIFDQKG